MAWRINEHVIRGEIDNRVRGRVTGSIWLVGRPEPVKLSLTGNVWRDLAGRKLEFANPAPQPGLPDGFSSLHHGQAGDITASRRVKVPEIPLDQIGAYHAVGKTWSWHWGNSLYLEWFSQSDGRDVIESASFHLTISPDSAWEMTAQEEVAQRDDNAAAYPGSVQRLGSAIDVGRVRIGNDSPPMTKEEAEQLQNESDRMVERIMARMEREGVDADFEKTVREENERARRERGEPALTPEEEAERSKWVDEMNAAAAGALEDETGERWKEGGDPPRNSFVACHPLAVQSFELSVKVMRDPIEWGWLPRDARPEHPLVELAMGVFNAGAKLAAALDLDWPPPLGECAMTIVQLKKAAGYLEDADLAAESCWEEWLTDAAWLEGVIGEITSMSNSTAEMINELRARLNPEAKP